MQYLLRPPCGLPVIPNFYSLSSLTQFTQLYRFSCIHSFKERGARNALLLLSKENKTRGVISASLGNHSQALSYHANKLNIPATVVMPNVAPIMKIEKCRSFGANVIIHGHDMKEAKHHAMSMAQDNSLVYING